MLAIKEAGYTPGVDVKLGLDVAASEFYDESANMYCFSDGKKMSKEELINYYEDLVNKYPVVSIEDPLEENDFEGFAKLTKKIGDRVQLVGDDFFTTNKELLQRGINEKAGNAILIKLNQIGTVTEAFETISLAKKNNYKTIISHRSGETEDTFIADLAVGLNMGQIKTGSLSRTDRVCKYNRLLRIYEEINR